MKVLADDGRAVSHATIEVTLDNKGHSTVTTDNHGRATFEVSTGLRVLSLQLVDGDDSVKEAIFELQDDENFLKEGDVRIVIRKRQVSSSLKFEGIFAEKLHFYTGFSTPSSWQQ